MHLLSSSFWSFYRHWHGFRKSQTDTPKKNKLYVLIIIDICFFPLSKQYIKTDSLIGSLIRIKWISYINTESVRSWWLYTPSILSYQCEKFIFFAQIFFVELLYRKGIFQRHLHCHPSDTLRYLCGSFFNAFRVVWSDFVILSAIQT